MILRGFSHEMMRNLMILLGFYGARHLVFFGTEIFDIVSMSFRCLQNYSQYM